MVTLLMWLYFLSTLIRVVRFSKIFYAKKVVPNDVMSIIALDVTLSFHRGVYCSHGDAPEGAVLKGKFLEDRRPKLSFWPRECIDIKDDLVQFWCGNMVKLSAMILRIGYLALWDGFGIVRCDFTIVFFQN